MSEIPIDRAKTRLHVVHKQRVLRLGDADPAPSFSKEGLDPPLIAAAADGWKRLLATEYESVVIAGWMTSALARFGAPLDVIGAFGRVVEDEIRHVDVVSEMIERFGGKPAVPSGATPPFPIGASGQGSEAEFELVSGLVSFFCVFEHLSAHVFRQALEAARVDLARWALSEIHRDEAFHGAFGFEAAKVFVARWPDALKKRLAERAIDGVKRFEERLGGPLPKEAERTPLPKITKDLEDLGLLSPPELLGTFYLAVEKELIPRFDDLGVKLDLRIDG
jgi:hypothetical protein